MDTLVGWLHNTKTHNPTHVMLSWSAWLGFIVLSVLHLPVPLTGDQALYMYGAKTLADGQMLYLDFWDAKQPGVYLFYLAAGYLFSFTEVGLHALEGIWLGIAAWCAYRLGRCALPVSRGPLLIPLFAAGSYFVSIDAWHMSQPDGLMATPLVAGAWALCDRDLIRSRSLGVFLAGICAGVAALFKISILFVPLAMFIAAHFLVQFNEDRPTRASFVRHLGSWALGASLPLAAITVWFAQRGALQELLWTTFYYPLGALVELDHHPMGLISSIWWFIQMTFFWLPFATVGAVWSIRQLLRRKAEGNAGVLMATWLVTGGVTMLLQYHYWWPFHFNQLFIPIGVLTGIGISIVIDYLNPKTAPAVTRVALAAMAVAIVVFGGRVTGKVLDVATGLRNDANIKAAYVGLFAPQSAIVASSVQAVFDDDDEGGSIYVFGDPRLLLASGRTQSVPHNGWALEIMTAEQWMEFSRALRAQSPGHIYVNRGYSNLLSRRSPELLEWIRGNYRIVHTDALAGDWYVLRSPQQ